MVESEKMLNISRDEIIALKIRIDELEKGMEENETEIDDLKSLNQTMMVIMHKHNYENQEARKELIKSMKRLQGGVTIGIKRLGELNPAPFAAAVKKLKCSGSGPPKADSETDSVEAGRLCSLWEKHLRDPGWHPYRRVRVGDKDQEIIDDEDPKLKGLKAELGEDAYKAVTTSLMEMNEYNPSGRYPVSEIWNFVEGRKASLKEGYSFVFKKLKNVGKSSVVSCPSIATANPSSSTPSSMDPCEIPQMEFHDFMADKSFGKFRSGQIWALYCYLDDLPRYYVQITRVKTMPHFEVHTQYLDSSLPKHKIPWADKSIPICCGTFNVGDESLVHKDVHHFSHMVCAKLVSKNIYEIYPRRGEVWAIYPRRGEVWAIYKDFKIWTCSDYKNCKYDIVEVVGDNVSKIQVLVLEQVTGFEKVFKPKKNSAGVDIIREITEAKLLTTFSHQIPAFLLTDENEGILRGYWELYRNSMPDCLFASN